MLRTVILAAGAALILPQAAAAGPVIDNEGHAYLTTTLMGQHATGKNERLEVESWQWGATRSGGNNQLKLDDSAGASQPATFNPYSIKKLSDSSSPTFAKPLPRGSLTVKGKLPGCAVGQRYAGMQFAGGGMAYQLSDVVITSCGPGQVTMNYAKVTVKGWNPEKKEL